MVKEDRSGEGLPSRALGQEGGSQRGRTQHPGLEARAWLSSGTAAASLPALDVGLLRELKEVKGQTAGGRDHRDHCRQAWLCSTCLCFQPPGDWPDPGVPVPEGPADWMRCGL